MSIASPGSALCIGEKKNTDIDVHGLGPELLFKLHVNVDQ